MEPPETEPGASDPGANKVPETRGAKAEASQPVQHYPLELTTRLPGTEHSVPLHQALASFPPGTQFHVHGYQKPPVMPGAPQARKRRWLDRIGAGMKLLVSTCLSLTIGSVIVIVWLASLKSCVTTVWRSPSQVEHFAAPLATTVWVDLFLLPNNQAILWYSDLQTAEVDGCLASWKGEYESHLIWRLWHIDNSAFGYRIYPGGYQPVVMETVVLKKFKMGRGDSVFPREGDKGQMVVLVSSDSLIVSGVTLKKNPLNADVLANMMSLLRPTPQRQ
jgi:hypothetical protein